MNARWLSLEYVAQSQGGSETKLHEPSNSYSSSIFPPPTQPTKAATATTTTPKVRSPLIVHEHCLEDSNDTRRPTIVIPAVRKGLNNQRMRIVQDIYVAIMMGANVELPQMLYGRVGCHYQESCYNDYTSVGTVPIWHVFDKESTLRWLHKFGVCVVEQGGHDTINEIPQPVGGIWSMSTSQLSHMLETGSMRLPSGRRWHLGGVENCCIKLVPDSIEAADLLRQINFSFETSRIMSEAAQRVERAVSQSIDGRNGKRQQTTINNSKYVALHWRNDEDFTGQVHKLNSTSYLAAASRALQNMRTTLSIPSDMPLHVVILGDLNNTALQAVEDAVNAVAVGGKGRALFICHSKMSLVPDMNLADISPSEDARGQVDFEIGVRAPVFIGSPFSSFSVFIAFKRSYDNNKSLSSYHQSTTAMIDADTADKTGAIFKLQFPYEGDDGRSDNPCADMIQLYDDIKSEMMGCSREASSSCPELVPAFTFRPALDDPRRLMGSKCDVVVVTTLFGIETLPDTSPKTRGSSCRFAFVNQETANALGIEPRLAYDTLPMHSVWNIVILDDAQLPFGPDPKENSRNSRAIKMLAHRGFRFANVMLYFDNQLGILKTEKVRGLVDMNLLSRSAAWVSPHHPIRQSAYSEAQCAHDSIDHVEEKVLEQMASYKAKGFPSAPAQHGGPGLIDGGWHLRNLRRPESDMIGCEWFREFQYWNHCHDELSFNYVVWSLFANGTTNGVVPSDPDFLYATYNESWYTDTEARQASPKIC
jgi:hypothetical protein